MVLIFTNKEDSHPNFVIEHLAEAGVPVFRFNTEALLTDYDFSWWADASGCDFSLKCRDTGLAVRGSGITSVWERRPEKPSELFLESTTEIDRHNLDEALGFLRFLRYYLKDVPSIGSIVGDIPAASKMLQMKIAHQVGFKIPQTCLSNSKAAILEHLPECRDVIIKPMESDSVIDDDSDTQWTFFAQKTSRDDLSNAPAEAFTQTVSFIQEYIDKSYELRVTVVGEKVLACRIDSQSQTEETGKTDWRQGIDNGIKWSAFDLPDDISGKCLSYLRKMSLNFGCFDFIVTPSGEYVFLECNPNGQWLWVELETGLPISQTIAKWLAEPRTAPDCLYHQYSKKL